MKETKREFFFFRSAFDKILLVRLASGLLRFFLSVVTIMSPSGDKKGNNSKDNTLRVDPYHHRFCTSVFRCGKVFSLAQREPGKEGSASSVALKSSGVRRNERPAALLIMRACPQDIG